MTVLALQIQDELIQALESDQLTLPTLPEVALRIREAVEDPDISLNELVRQIGTDAALSARLIKVVNSPLLRSRQEITDLSMAVNRLGVVYTANLATGLAMSQLFQATTDVIDRKMREVWARSTEVAGISHVLSRHYTTLKFDQAMLAGLVHQIGILPILSYAEEHQQLLRDAASLDLIIERIHPLLGDRILQAWDFPQPLRHIPSQHLDFTRQPENVDYADVVQVAMLQSLAGSSHPFAQLDYATISSFTRLGLSPAADQDEEDLAAEMEAAMLLLN